MQNARWQVQFGEIGSMMTFIKIVFIIMLIIPIGILMRRLLIGLSSEQSAQTDSEVPVAKPKRVDKAASASKGNEKDKARKKKKNRSGTSDSQVREDETKTRDQNTGSSGSYTPRQPEQWQRSERVPFGESEGYRVDPPKKKPIAENPSLKQWKKPSDALREKNEEKADRAVKQSAKDDPEKAVAIEKDEKATKKRKRSEKTPSKRQLRKNRERARKRDMKRRKEERDS